MSENMSENGSRSVKTLSTRIIDLDSASTLPKKPIVAIEEGNHFENEDGI